MTTFLCNFCRLEEKYEEHPLIDVFNVYLQIFLSQALEPGFLSAIMEEKGKNNDDHNLFKKLDKICCHLIHVYFKYLLTNRGICIYELRLHAFIEDEAS